MKKSIRKSFLVPVLVALVGVLVVCQSQAQFAYITNTGSITITGYAGYGGVVVIPATITGLPVTAGVHGGFALERWRGQPIRRRGCGVTQCVGGFN
jgi:hypothetical protein